MILASFSRPPASLVLLATVALLGGRFSFSFSSGVQVVSAARWYSLICTTGPVQTISFRDNDGFWNETGIGGGRNSSRSGSGSGNDGRSLLRGQYSRFMHTPERATAALPWTWTSTSSPDRKLRALQDADADMDGSFYLDDDVAIDEVFPPSYAYAFNPETGEANGNGNGNETLQYRVRPCMCHPANVNKDYFGPNETIPDLYLCPAASDYCGIPLQGEGWNQGEGQGQVNVGCFSISVQQVVARNAWPLILLWYFGMVVICCFTVHGSTSWGYFRSCFDPERNLESADRLLARNAEGPAPAPRSYWNWWSWQRYRFEQNLLAQSQWIWRHEEYARVRQQRQLGLPPPQYEMKTKRFSRDQLEEEGNGNDNDQDSTAENNTIPNEGQAQGQAHQGHHDDDSLHEPTCTICFAPLEDGELVGDLQCTHIFHKECLKTWCTRKNACPLCNVPIANRRTPGTGGGGGPPAPETEDSEQQQRLDV